MNNNWYSFNGYYDDVSAFNYLAGKTEKPTLTALRQQLALIKEEVQEIEDGLNNKDAEEVLDGAVDTLYVLFGFMQKLQALGADIKSGMLITAENNLTKFPDDMQTVTETLKLNPTYTFKQHSDSQFAILDANNKVVKPVGYVKNNLSSCVKDFDTGVFDE